MIQQNCRVSSGLAEARHLSSRIKLSSEEKRKSVIVKYGQPAGCSRKPAGPIICSTLLATRPQTTLFRPTLKAASGGDIYESASARVLVPVSCNAGR